MMHDKLDFSFSFGQRVGVDSCLADRVIDKLIGGTFGVPLIYVILKFGVDKLHFN
jgi:hypothetical protein